MNAWDMVAEWAEDRAKKMRADAERSVNAYTTGPMADACAAYGAALAVAAHVIERDAVAFRARAKAEAAPLASDSTERDE